MKIPAPRSVVEKSKRAATSARERVDAAAQSARQGAGTVAETARRGAGTVARSAREGAGAVADSARRGAGAVAETARQGATAVADSARRGAGAARRGASTVSESAGQAAELARGRLADLSNLSVAAIASTLSADLNSALASLAEGPATIYDKAMDAEYLATHIGGGSHRLFDGGHTLWGALRATRDASTEDTLSQEAFGYMQGLFRDGTTPKSGFCPCTPRGDSKERPHDDHEGGEPLRPRPVDRLVRPMRTGAGGRRPSVMATGSGSRPPALRREAGGRSAELPLWR